MIVTTKQLYNVAYGKFAVGAYNVNNMEQILGLFLRHEWIVVAIGIGVGVGSAVAAGQSLASLVFGVAVTDPITLATAAALLIAVSLLACYIPAQSATRLDPITVLRAE